MDNPEQLRETVLKYRLNEMESTDREAIDALLISDAEFHSAFREGEYDLLDAYAANELTERERQRVEQALHPRSHPSFGLHSRLHEGRDRPASRMASESVVTGARKGKLFAMPLSAVWAVAAVVVLAVAMGWVWHSHTPPAQSVATAVDQAPVGSKTPASGEPAPPGGVPVAQSSSPSTQSAGVQPVILLLVGGARSQNMAQVKLARTVKELRVQWVPDAPPQPDAQYQLAVVSDVGTPECRSKGTPHKRTGQNPVVEFVCPASNISAGVSFFRIYESTADPEALPLLETTVSVKK